MGGYLLEDLGKPLAQLDHRLFASAKALIDERGETYLERSIAALSAAVAKLYGGQTVSLQRLSATFRRGDLLTLV